MDLAGHVFSRDFHLHREKGNISPHGVRHFPVPWKGGVMKKLELILICYFKNDIQAILIDLSDLHKKPLSFYSELCCFLPESPPDRIFTWLALLLL
jgi:hypothetical protein